MYPHAEKILPNNILILTKLFFNDKKTISRASNDYNKDFLPNTEYLKLDYKKILIDKIGITEGGYLKKIKSQRYSFFIDSFNEFIFLGTKNGQIFYLKKLDILNFKENRLNIHTLKTNLPKQVQIRDIGIIDGNIFLSIANQIEKNCTKLELLKSKIDLNEKLKFNKIFQSSECAVKGIEAGKIQFWKENNTTKILLTASADGIVDDNESDHKPQDDNSIFGKILLIDQENNNFQIFSKGHRNSLGLYADTQKKIILNTENGPEGGDEINLIKKGKNYGWDFASYGK